RDGETGLLVRSGDADALAGAIGRLLGDPDLRARLGRAGRALVLREFDLHRNAEALVERFAAVAAARSGGGPDARS
ncbi:MAG TPA: glycosyltransferase, partial [Candidatus Limnocylindrales bacterium]|nr:glycosyltransferase [Candidatus Limnocylindrales bacterium]